LELRKINLRCLQGHQAILKRLKAAVSLDRNRRLLNSDSVLVTPKN
jgi:hypothetical protein